MSHQLKKSLVLAAGLLALPAVSFAQEFTGAVTLGYGKTDVSDFDQDITNLSLDGRLNADFGNGFKVRTDLSMNELEVDDVDGSLNIIDFNLEGSYGFAGGFSLGAYVEHAKIDIDGLAEDVSATSYGLTAGYNLNGVELGAYIGSTGTDPDLPDGVDIRDMGISAKYAPSEQLSFGGIYQRTTVDAGTDDIDLSLFGVAAAYAINDEWGVFGGISRASISEVDVDATTMSIGVSYDLKKATNFGAVVSLELARTNIDLGGGDGDLNTVRLGLTIPLGGERTVAPLNSMADSILNPRHSAITSTALGIF